MKTVTKLWIGLGILAFLSPLGILLPKYFKSGGAWGEDGGLPGFWHAPIPDYGATNISYIFSAFLGIAVVAIAMIVLGKIFVKRGDN